MLILHVFILVYKTLGYMSTVSKVTENSMSKAIEEIKALPNYRADGEVCMHNCFMYITIIVHLLK